MAWAIRGLPAGRDMCCSTATAWEHRPAPNSPQNSLPALEGCPQRGSYCPASVPLAPASLSCPPTVLLTCEVMVWRQGSWHGTCPLLHWEQRWCLQSLSLLNGCCSATGTAELVPQSKISQKDVQRTLLEVVLTWSQYHTSRKRLKVLLPWSQEVSGAMWWLRLTHSLLLSVRALNHFVLFHFVTWIHFKLWNSPFLPWLICEICHLLLWFALCPS